jgi:DNA-binding transcriptional regulator YhcF (GntR family)/tetratricopeptide (TPR) repeat protein
MSKTKIYQRIVSFITLVAFVVMSAGPVSAQVNLPSPGQMVALSPAFNPPVLKGIKVYRNDPFRFDFILDTGDEGRGGSRVRPLAQSGRDKLGPYDADATRLIKYFLASLTIPEKDLWVNLSPYEKDRIVPEAFGQTEMGRDLLAQDYMLKQITASLLYPEGETGKAFWQKVYAEAQQRFGTTDIPVDTFNKVWIVPERAEVYENKDAAFVVESRLKVMMDRDYVAQSCVGADFMSARIRADIKSAPTSELAKQVLKEIIIPILEKEVNEGANFASLRQVYNSLILATWYKRKVKESLLGKAYVDKKKTAGVDIADKAEADKIWQKYVEAFRKGAYNLVREEVDAYTGEAIPRKYVSGGANLMLRDHVRMTHDPAMLPSIGERQGMVISMRADPAMDSSVERTVVLDASMKVQGMEAFKRSMRIARKLVDQVSREVLDARDNEAITFLAQIGVRRKEMLLSVGPGSKIGLPVFAASSGLTVHINQPEVYAPTHLGFQAMPAQHLQEFKTRLKKLGRIVPALRNRISIPYPVPIQEAGIPSNVYDYVFLAAVLDGVTEAEGFEIAREAVRVTKDHGVVMVSTKEYPNFKYFDLIRKAAAAEGRYARRIGTIPFLLTAAFEIVDSKRSMARPLEGPLKDWAMASALESRQFVDGLWKGHERLEITGGRSGMRYVLERLPGSYDYRVEREDHPGGEDPYLNGINVEPLREGFVQANLDALPSGLPIMEFGAYLEPQNQGEGLVSSTLNELAPQIRDKAVVMLRFGHFPTLMALAKAVDMQGEEALPSGWKEDVRPILDLEGKPEYEEFKDSPWFGRRYPFRKERDSSTPTEELIQKRNTLKRYIIQYLKSPAYRDRGETSLLPVLKGTTFVGMLERVLEQGNLRLLVTRSSDAPDAGEEITAFVIPQNRTEGVITWSLPGQEAREDRAAMIPSDSTTSSILQMRPPPKVIEGSDAYAFPREFSTIDDFVGRYVYWYDGQKIALQAAIESELPKALYVMGMIQDLRDQMDKNGMERVPLVLWQNMRLGELFPFFGQEMKTRFGVLEIAGTEYRRLATGTGILPEEMINSRYILIKEKVPSSFPAENHLYQDYQEEDWDPSLELGVVKTVESFAKRLQAPIIVIDASARPLSGAQSLLFNARGILKTIVYSQGTGTFSELDDILKSGGTPIVLLNAAQGYLGEGYTSFFDDNDLFLDVNEQVVVAGEQVTFFHAFRRAYDHILTLKIDAEREVEGDRAMQQSKEEFFLQRQDVQSTVRKRFLRFLTDSFAEVMRAAFSSTEKNVEDVRERLRASSVYFREIGNNGIYFQEEIVDDPAGFGGLFKKGDKVLKRHLDGTDKDTMKALIKGALSQAEFARMKAEGYVGMYGNTGNKALRVLTMRQMPGAIEVAPPLLTVVKTFLTGNYARFMYGYPKAGRPMRVVYSFSANSVQGKAIVDSDKAMDGSLPPLMPVDTAISVISNALAEEQAGVLQELQNVPVLPFNEVKDKFESLDDSGIGYMYRLKNPPTGSELRQLALFDGEIVVARVRGANEWIMRLHNRFGKVLRRSGPGRQHVDNMLFKSLSDLDLLEEEYHNHPNGENAFPSLMDLAVALTRTSKMFLITQNSLIEFRSHEVVNLNGRLFIPGYGLEIAEQLAAAGVKVKEIEGAGSEERVKLLKQLYAQLHFRVVEHHWGEQDALPQLSDESTMIDQLKSASPQERIRAVFFLEALLDRSRGLYREVLNLLGRYAANDPNKYVREYAYDNLQHWEKLKFTGVLAEAAGQVLSVITRSAGDAGQANADLLDFNEGEVVTLLKALAVRLKEQLDADGYKLDVDLDRVDRDGSNLLYPDGVNVVTPGVLSGLELSSYWSMKEQFRGVNFLQVLPFKSLGFGVKDPRHLFAKAAVYVNRQGRIGMGIFDTPLRVDAMDYNGMEVSNVKALYDRGIPMFTAPEVFRLAEDKNRFSEFLRARGFKVPREIKISAGEKHEGIEEPLKAFLSLLGDREVVVKPNIGSGGNGVRMFSARQLSGIQAYTASLAVRGDVLIQERIEPREWKDGRTGVVYDYNFRVFSTWDGDGLTLTPDMIVVRYKKRSMGPANLSLGGEAMTFARFCELQGYDREQTGRLFERIKRNVVQGALAIEEAFPPRGVSYRSTGFLGWDIILDQDDQPYVLEVGAGPVGAVDDIEKHLEQKGGAVLPLLRYLAGIALEARERYPQLEAETELSIFDLSNDEYIMNHVMMQNIDSSADLTERVIRHVIDNRAGYKRLLLGHYWFKNLGRILLEREAYAEVESVLRSGLKEGYYSVELFDMLSTALSARADHDGARAIMEEALEKGYMSPDIYLRLAVSYLYERQFSRAEAVLRGALDQGHRFEEVFIYLLVALKMLNRDGEASELSLQYRGTSGAWLWIEKEAAAVYQRMQQTGIVDNGQKTSSTGGIDLSSSGIEVKVGGESEMFYIDPDRLKALAQASGLVPVIINMESLGSLPQFLGIPAPADEPVRF